MPFINSVPNIDFLAQRKKAAVISIGWWLFSMCLIIFRGPSWGIDFTGGSEIRIRFESPVPIEDVRASMVTLNLGADSVQQIGASDKPEYVIRVQDPTFGTEAPRRDVEQALKAKFGDTWIAESRVDAEVGSRITVHYTGDPVDVALIQEALAGVNDAIVSKAQDENTIYVKLPGLAASVKETLDASIDKPFEVLAVDSVGPSVGNDLRNQGFMAVGITCLLLLVYVAIRFEFTFAPGAIIALLHDVINVVGCFIVLEMFGVFDHEFNLQMIGALLTTLGYSINDTIIIYDRIRENQKKYRRRDLAQIMNLSVNETLGRTIGTSMTTIIAVMPFIFLGGDVIETFALAIFLGVVFGTYSTVYVAAPLTMVFEDLRPYFVRLVAGGGEPAVASATAEGLTESERRRREREAKAAERKSRDLG